MEDGERGRGTCRLQKNVPLRFPWASGEGGFPLVWLWEEVALSPSPLPPHMAKAESLRPRGRRQMPVLGLDTPWCSGSTLCPLHRAGGQSLRTA